MSAEIRALTSSGLTVYAQVLNGSGQVWNGTTFETYTAGNWGDYDIALTEQGSSGRYIGNFPSGITTAGDYEFYAYRQLGASPAQSDVAVGVGKVEWSGSAVVASVDATDTTIALISLADAEEYLKMSGSVSSAIQNILVDLINQCSIMSNRFVGRQLLAKSFTEFYNGNGESELLLRNYPINSITSLYNDTEDRLFNSSTQIDVSSDVLIMKDKGIIRLWNNESIFNVGTANIKITYNAGWTLSTVPYDLQLAVRKWVAKEYQKFDKLQHLVQSETIGENTRTYIAESMPSDVKQILSAYKQTVHNPDFAYEST